MRKRTGLLPLALAILVAAAAGCAPRPAPVQRIGSVIGIKPEAIPEYKKLHAAVWPEILQKLREVNIRNYSIYLVEIEKGQWCLFSYFEYTGSDFKGDMAKMAADPNTKRWWSHTDPLQTGLPTRAEGEWWHAGEEVFHME
jgi:L-rhamnose mutarotase